MLEHPFGDMAGNVHDGLVARLSGFGQAGDEGVTVVVPATLDAGGFANLPPDRLETGARLGWIGGLGLAGWKDKPLAVVLIVLFGSKKLPHAARSLGQSMRILKKEVQGLHEEESDPPAQAQSTAPEPSSRSRS